MAVSSGSFLDGHSPFDKNICIFLAQMVIIVCLSRFIGFFLKKMNQPAVISEVLGGIILGPTVLSRIPGFKDTLFPVESLPRLKLIADFGLMLYLFLIGMELDPIKVMAGFKKSARISLAGIILPFGAGVGVSKIIYDTYMVSTVPAVPFTSFFVFCGVAMSITAFPVLARILTEQKLLSTDVGQITLAAAGTDDAIAWCLLILVVALINNPAKAYNAIIVFFIIIAFAIFLWFAIRPVITYFIDQSDADNGADQFNVFLIFLIMMCGAFFTEAAGVDTIFGAFLVGLVTPHHKGFSVAVTEKIEDFISILFLPLYFGYAGLNIQLADLNDGQSWAFVVLVVAVACGGKIIGCSLAARSSGIPWRESLTVGFLMNTKGLVELIVLNLGLQAGVITKKVYAIFLVMALVTTFMTVPIVSYIYPAQYHTSLNLGGSSMNGEKDEESHVRRSEITIGAADNEAMQVLICLPSMRVVPAMMNLNQMLFQSGKKINFFALRLVELGQRMSKVMMATEGTKTMQTDPVVNIFRTFAQLNKHSVKTLMSVTTYANFASDVIDASVSLGTNLIIFPVDHSQSSYPKGWGKTVAEDLWEHAMCPVAFLVDRGFGVSSVNDFVQDPLAAVPGQNQNIFFAFTGCADDLEGAVLINYLAHYSHITVVIFSLGISKEDDSQAGRALSAICSFPNVTLECVEKAVDPAMKLISRAAHFGPKDLVVLSHALYTTNTSASSFRFWLDHGSKSSYMIVKRPSDSGVEVVAPVLNGGIPKRRVLNRNLSDLPLRPSSVA